MRSWCRWETLGDAIKSEYLKTWIWNWAVTKYTRLHPRLTGSRAISVLVSLSVWHRLLVLPLGQFHPPIMQLPSHQSIDLHSILSLTYLNPSDLSSMTWVLFVLISRSTTTISWILHKDISTLFESQRTRLATIKVTWAIKLKWWLSRI